MNLTPNLSVIDETTRGSHARLLEEDKCCYLWEYETSERCAPGNTSSLINNIKKNPLKKALPEYRFKASGIRQCSNALTNAINKNWLTHGTLVPVPPSKTKDHPEYDDRMLQICRGIQAPEPVDVREMVFQRVSTEAFHMGAHNRLTVEQLVEIYEINEQVSDPPPTSISIIDDVITAGTHFKAMQHILQNRFPNVDIFGIFIARRKLPVVQLSQFNDAAFQFGPHTDPKA